MNTLPKKNKEGRNCPLISTSRKQNLLAITLTSTINQSFFIMQHEVYCHEWLLSSEIDSDNEDQIFLHILDCLCAVSRALVYDKYCQNDRICKRRVFWKTVAAIANFEIQAAELKVENKHDTIIPMGKLLQYFSDNSIRSEERSWLPLHFSAALPNDDLSEFQILYNSQPELLKQEVGGEEEKLNPFHLIAMMQDPPLEIIQKLKEFRDHIESSVTTSNVSPLHIAARYSNSIEMIRELIQIHPPAVTTTDVNGLLPLHYSRDNKSPAALRIVQILLETAPETARMVNNSGQLPLHYFLESKPRGGKMIATLLEAHRDAVNVRDDDGQLPIHFEHAYSSLEVFKTIAEANINHLSSSAGYYSTIHAAVRQKKIDIVRYIHSFQPQELFKLDCNHHNPLHIAFISCDSNFIKALYALQPEAVKVAYNRATHENLLHLLAHESNSLQLHDPLSDGSESLRFLLRVFPEGVTARTTYGSTPFDLFGCRRFNSYSFEYARRLMLQVAPTFFKSAERKQLNYTARRNALFAFFAVASEPNVFTRIRNGAGGEMLIRKITCYL